MLLGLQSHFYDLTFKHFIFLNLPYFSLVYPYISRYVNIYDLNLLLDLIDNIVSGHWASILILHWIVKSSRVKQTLLSIIPSGSWSYFCIAPSRQCSSHSLQWHSLPCPFHSNCTISYLRNSPCFHCLGFIPYIECIFDDLSRSPQILQTEVFL